MKNIVTRRASCRLCGSEKHELILRLAPTPLADSYLPASQSSRVQEKFPLDLFLCLECGQSQILDVIAPEVIYRDYIYVTTSSLGLSTHFNAYADHVLRKLGATPGSLAVDIGSNDGTLLSSFKKNGMKVLGVEPATETAKQATLNGVETLPEFFDKNLAETIKRKYGPAQIVTMNNLFANLDDLQDTAQGVRELLGPTGVFVFETFYFVDFIENMVFDFMYHEHVSYNTVKPLVRYFKKNGLELFDIERVPTKGGSIRCFVQLAGGSRTITPIVSELMQYETKIGIHENGRLFTEYNERIQTEKTHTVETLKKLKSEGKTIAGYGASATTTTLLYHFELMDFIDFFIDDNPAKQNTVSPGCHIPVYSSESIKSKRPDVIVIFAWRYSEPIIKANQSFLQNGGSFIIPLPKFSVHCRQ